MRTEQNSTVEDNRGQQRTGKSTGGGGIHVEWNLKELYRRQSNLEEKSQRWEKKRTIEKIGIDRDIDHLWTKTKVVGCSNEYENILDR